MNTTIVGLLAAIFAAIQSIVQQGNSIEDWKTWALPAALAALGFLAKDQEPTLLKATQHYQVCSYCLHWRVLQSLR